ncbi:MAG: DNRLRE domain-containing protein [Syntrophomonadaceae bacterium]|nr:DNRLRE domain-containing protein [Syntrophomonadaceae bacterium]MDD4549442.1 DNRLRE domain-containing protein [Syntrophomonadaceae bacterium]
MAVFTLLPYQNTYIAEWYPTTNFANRKALFLSRYLRNGDIYRSLIQFDLQQIPPLSTIETAELELTMYRNEVTKSTTVTAHRLLSNWTGNQVVWNTQPNYSAEPDSEILISPKTLSTQRINITSLVKGWHNGSIPNNGILLKGNEEINSLIAFCSSNHHNSSEWPKLHINFVSGILSCYEKEELKVPHYPETPIIASTPIPLGSRKQASFLIVNMSNSPSIKVRLQVGYDYNESSTFFDTGPWVHLKRSEYPGEAIALTTFEAAEFARVLIIGSGGENINVYPRTKEY